MANKLQTCVDCRHYETKTEVMGLCHRYPPQVAGSFVGGPDPNNANQVVGKILNDTFWPAVPSNAWCGEYQISLLLMGKIN